MLEASSVFPTRNIKQESITRSDRRSLSYVTDDDSAAEDIHAKEGLVRSAEHPDDLDIQIRSDFGLETQSMEFPEMKPKMQDRPFGRNGFTREQTIYLIQRRLARSCGGQIGKHGWTVILQDMKQKFPCLDKTALQLQMRMYNLTKQCEDLLFKQQLRGKPVPGTDLATYCQLLSDHIKIVAENRTAKPQRGRRADRKTVIKNIESGRLLCRRKTSLKSKERANEREYEPLTDDEIGRSSGPVQISACEDQGSSSDVIRTSYRPRSKTPCTSQNRRPAATGGFRSRKNEFSSAQSLLLIKIGHKNPTGRRDWKDILEQYRVFYPDDLKTSDEIRQHYYSLWNEHVHFSRRGTLPSNGIRKKRYALLEEAFEEMDTSSPARAKSLRPKRRNPTREASNETVESEKPSTSYQTRSRPPTSNALRTIVQKSDDNSRSTQLVARSTQSKSVCNVEGGERMPATESDEGMLVLPCCELLPENFAFFEECARRCGGKVQAFLDELTPDVLAKAKHDLLRQNAGEFEYRDWHKPELLATGSSS